MTNYIRETLTTDEESILYEIKKFIKEQDENEHIIIDFFGQPFISKNKPEITEGTFGEIQINGKEILKGNIKNVFSDKYTFSLKNINSFNEDPLFFYKDIKELLLITDLYETNDYYIIDLSKFLEDSLKAPDTKTYFPQNENLILGIVFDKNFKPLFNGDKIFLRSIKKEYFGYSACIADILISNYEAGTLLNNYIRGYRHTYNENLEIIDIVGNYFFMYMKKEGHLYKAFISETFGYSHRGYIIAEDPFFRKLLFNGDVVYNIKIVEDKLYLYRNNSNYEIYKIDNI